ASWTLPKGYVVCGISPDGRWALLRKGETDELKTFHLWDLTARKELRTFQGKGDLSDEAYALFSPDGKVVATNSGLSGRGNTWLVRVWDLASGRELWQEGSMDPNEG